jgi:hypothetical protein
VTIAGNTVMPLKPIMSRPTYTPLNSSGFNRPNPGPNGSLNYGVNRGYGNSNPGTHAPAAYIPWANTPTRSGTLTAPAAPSGSWTTPAAPSVGYRPSAPSRGFSGGPAAPPPVSRPSGGGSLPHVSAGGGGGGGRVSGGGGGGGGGHVNAGGGGGGGHVGGGGAAPPAAKSH